MFYTIKTKLDKRTWVIETKGEIKPKDFQDDEKTQLLSLIYFISTIRSVNSKDKLCCIWYKLCDGLELDDEDLTTVRNSMKSIGKGAYNETKWGTSKFFLHESIRRAKEDDYYRIISNNLSI